MAAQSVGFSLLLISCLLALASPAPLSPVTSLEDGDEALSKALNLVQPSRLDVHLFKDDVIGENTDVPKSYVDASVFRKSAPPSPADAVKPKPSFFVKKTISNLNKNTKEGHEMKNVLVPSDKLEPPVDEKAFDAEVDHKVVAILSAIREIVDTEGRNYAESTTSQVKNDETSTTMTSSGTNEDGDLPRLSPPIWLHSSLAEAMSDPLRLPMIEPYDRYDRYSHSIARDALW